MFKLNLADAATKVAGDTAQDTVNTAGQKVQQVMDQATEAGQKVIDDVCKTVQDAGEKASQSVTGQISTWGKSFGQSEEEKEKKDASS